MLIVREVVPGEASAPDAPPAEATSRRGETPEAAVVVRTADAAEPEAGSDAPEPETLDVAVRTVPVLAPAEAEAPPREAEAVAAPAAGTDDEAAATQAAAAPPASVAGFEAALARDPAAAVRGVQDRLNALGFEVGAATGRENARTRLALARFQEANGLEPTGELGARVLEALASADAPQAGASGEDGPGLAPPPEAEPAARGAGDAPASEGTPSTPEATEADPQRSARDAAEAEPQEEAGPEPVRFADPQARARAVARVQEALEAQGFDAGPADGIAGRRTRDAIAAFQVERGMSVTGALDARLLEALDLPAP